LGRTCRRRGRSAYRAPTNPRLTTGIEDLAEAIRAWAKGWLPAEAAAELLISHRAWLLREDFLQVAVEVRWEPFRDRHVGAVDFAAAAEAVQGVLPCSDGFSELCKPSCKVGMSHQVTVAIRVLKARRG